jgi:GntR family transcriptional regulator
MRGSQISDDVFRTLKDSIERGVFPAGRRLPGERNLAVSLGVSRDTIRVALERLEGEGVVSRSAQRGWFVPRQTIGEPPSTLQSFTEMARLRGLAASAVVLEKRVRSATFEEAAKLTIVPGAEVLYIARLRGMSGTPICVDSNVIPLATSRALLDVDLTDQSLYDVLERLCGLRIHRSAYSVQADAASNDLAPLLQVPVGSPVLVGREVAYNDTGNPVLLGLNTYRGDAYRFEADLYRPSS